MRYQKLFSYLAEEHGVILLENEMQEIVRIVDEMHDEEQAYEDMCTGVRRNPLD